METKKSKKSEGQVGAELNFSLHEQEDEGQRQKIWTSWNTRRRWDSNAVGSKRFALKPQDAPPELHPLKSKIAP